LRVALGWVALRRVTCRERVRVACRPEPRMELSMPLPATSAGKEVKLGKNSQTTFDRRATLCGGLFRKSQAALAWQIKVDDARRQASTIAPVAVGRSGR
jgi:hypothetical protein